MSDAPVSFRLARPDEIPAIARMVVHSFPGATRPPAWWESQLADPAYGGGAETVVVGMDAGRPVAACQIHPLRQWVSGVRLASSGVGSVAVAPTHRKRRLGAALVAAALRIARERGDVVSALYPFRVAFYQKLGYGHAGDAFQYLIPPAVLADAPERAGIELIAGDAARAEALALYDAWIRTQNGQLERGARHWRELTAVHDRVLVAYRADGGGLEGYALASYRADLPSRERFLEVDELVWTTPAARRALHAWLASLGDQWKRLLVRTLPSHRFADYLTEPRLPSGAAPMWGLWAPAATVMAGTMFRVLDVPGAWRARRVAPDARLVARIEVHDATVPENDGAWRLAFEAGAVAVEQGGTGAADVTLRLDVSALSRLYCAALTPSAALDAGLLACDRPAALPALDAALVLPEPWTFDRF
jgi:predicted acetyltransferase